ncbi:hypothetical protein B0H12DRAFT_164920 [Mycena haematopus]|nr:hypothetical protein B0H12DRAFT_164920 [Mycena haematopus]
MFSAIYRLSFESSLSPGARWDPIYPPADRSQEQARGNDTHPCCLLRPWTTFLTSTLGRRRLLTPYAIPRHPQHCASCLGSGAAVGLAASVLAGCTYLLRGFEVLFGGLECTMLLFRSRWLHLPAPSDGRALVANVWRLVSRLRFFCAHRAWNAEKAAAQSHSYESRILPPTLASSNIAPELIGFWISRSSPSTLPPPPPRPPPSPSRSPSSTSALAVYLLPSLILLRLGHPRLCRRLLHLGRIQNAILTRALVL